MFTNDFLKLSDVYFVLTMSFLDYFPPPSKLNYESDFHKTTHEKFFRQENFFELCNDSLKSDQILYSSTDLSQIPYFDIICPELFHPEPNENITSVPAVSQLGDSPGKRLLCKQALKVSTSLPEREDISHKNCFPTSPTSQQPTIANQASWPPSRFIIILQDIPTGLNDCHRSSSELSPHLIDSKSHVQDNFKNKQSALINTDLTPTNNDSLLSLDYSSSEENNDALCPTPASAESITISSMNPVVNFNITNLQPCLLENIDLQAIKDLKLDDIYEDPNVISDINEILSELDNGIYEISKSIGINHEDILHYKSPEHPYDSTHNYILQPEVSMYCEKEQEIEMVKNEMEGLVSSEKDKDEDLENLLEYVIDLENNINYRQALKCELQAKIRYKRAMENKEEIFLEDKDKKIATVGFIKFLLNHILYDF